MSNAQGIVARLRNYSECHDGDIDEAADMLEFLLGQMQSYSMQMNGQHSYRFHSGWPMTHAKGPTPEDAIRAAIKEVKREQKSKPETICGYPIVVTDKMPVGTFTLVNCNPKRTHYIKKDDEK